MSTRLPIAMLTSIRQAPVRCDLTVRAEIASDVVGAGAGRIAMHGDLQIGRVFVGGAASM